MVFSITLQDSVNGCLGLCVLKVSPENDSCRFVILVFKDFPFFLIAKLLQLSSTGYSGSSSTIGRPATSSSSSYGAAGVAMGKAFSTSMPKASVQAA